MQAVLDQALHGEETANFGKMQNWLRSLNWLSILFLPLYCCLEFPLMTKGGIRLEVLLNATTRRDEQGNIIGERDQCFVC